jgi:hypothetical protein
MADNKTKPTDMPVEEYLATITPTSRQSDCRALTDLMSEVSGQPPAMWGPAIIGFGLNHYLYESGRRGIQPEIGFASRKNAITIYGGCGGLDGYSDILDRLGKYTRSKVCIYIKRLSDVDQSVLREFLARSVEEARMTDARPGDK